MTRDDRPAISIDLGGTIIKAGLVQGGRVIVSSTIPAQSQEGLAAQLPRIETLVDQLCGEAMVQRRACSGVGVAFPTLIDPNTARPIAPMKGKYADACELDLKRWALESLGLPLHMENDAHAALLGEWKFGAGREASDLITMTLGTGIGVSVLLRGKLLRGKHYQAGVLGGHVVVVPNGRECSCGGRGCVEAETSARYLPDLAARETDFASSTLRNLPHLDYAAVFRCAAAGDLLAIRLRDRAMDLWASLIVSLIHVFDPERIVIGGGIMRSAEVILPHIRAFVAQNAWTPWGKVDIQAAALGDDACLVGLSVLSGESMEYL
jgi:glucokinase